MLAIREGEPIQGSLRVLNGTSGLLLYEHTEALVLRLDDGRLLAIIMQTPIDLTDDSWAILGDGPIQSPKTASP